MNRLINQISSEVQFSYFSVLIIYVELNFTQT
jgi:hypothetical protein